MKRARMGGWRGGKGRGTWQRTNTSARERGPTRHSSYRLSLSPFPAHSNILACTTMPKFIAVFVALAVLAVSVSGGRGRQPKRNAWRAH